MIDWTKWLPEPTGNESGLWLVIVCRYAIAVVGIALAAAVIWFLYRVAIVVL